MINKKYLGLGQHALSHLLSKTKFKTEHSSSDDDIVKKLQLKMLRIQQGLWHSKRRAIIVFEGFDTAGKGGAIRTLTESLDPRGLRVHPIGPPATASQGKHYLYRFWRDLPEPGALAIFDRSWYGRVLVERVERLTPKTRWQEAYNEINQFEAMLVNDGVDIVKFFLAIHPEEQLRRFEARLRDPYKQWKLTEADIEARGKWREYVKASDELLYRCHTRQAPWSLIAADAKEYARAQVLQLVTHSLSHHEHWMESLATKTKHLKKELKHLKTAEKRRKKKS